MTDQEEDVPAATAPTEPGPGSGAPERPPRPVRRARRRDKLWRAAVAAALLTVVGYLGGVAVTALWPITVQTHHYAAEVSLSPPWHDTSTVRTPTVFGDIALHFAGPVPAPGVEARVQVREEITELFTRGSYVDIADFTPDPEELRATMDQGVRELGWKFLGGVLATQSVLVALWLLGRGRGPGRPLLTGATVAAVLATVAPASSAMLTYREDNFASYEVTSLLGTVRSNSGMLTDIQGAARQATPYVYNLLALSDALHAEFVPEETTREPAARFLLVSDVHGMNYYALMERIVQTEGITAVIDTGDLLNFGRAAEGEMSGIFAAIADLEVPYIFVRGNHDAAGPGDEAVLRRMAQIPNVILVEPADGEYVEAQVHGVRITGFNDWRWFAEQRGDFGEQQRAAAERYAAATQGWPLPDILISHQPYALRPLDTAGVKINGHMHTAGLEGNQITVGTFTGGGLVNHFQLPSDEDPQTAGEVAGAPYAFDILAFSDDCSVQSLTRYTYRNLVLGRPQFDGVSVVNGARIAAPAEEGRACGPQLGVGTVPVEPVVPDEE